jgi:hypothetical protein
VKQSIFIDPESKILRFVYIYPDNAMVSQETLEKVKKSLTKIFCASDPVLRAKIESGYTAIVTYIYDDQVAETVISSCSE